LAREAKRSFACRSPHSVQEGVALLKGHAIAVAIQYMHRKLTGRDRSSNHGSAGERPGRWRLPVDPETGKSLPEMSRVAAEGVRHSIPSLPVTAWRAA
jgi:hypothetical protein